MIIWLIWSINKPTNKPRVVRLRTRSLERSGAQLQQAAQRMQLKQAALEMLGFNVGFDVFSKKIDVNIDKHGLSWKHSIHELVWGEHKVE